MSALPREKAPTLGHDVFPIFHLEHDVPHARVIADVGTGFLIGPRLLMTCWHCVSAVLPDGQFYAAAVPYGDTRAMKVLVDIEKVEGGADLAMARIDQNPSLALSIVDEIPAYGADVWTFGFPLTERIADAEVGLRFVLGGRYLEGYMTRTCRPDMPGFGPTDSFELDMLVPEGLSGAPLMLRKTTEVIGVLYGSHDVATIAERARFDDETGDRIPEIHRLVSFGLAHFTDTIANATSSLTNGEPLSEFLASQKSA